MHFHHLGIACTDLDTETATYRPLGYLLEGNDFDNTIQGIRGRFLVGGGPRLELLVGLPRSDVLTPWINRGVKIYHVAFEVDPLAEALDDLRAERVRIVSAPMPAVAFCSCRVAFLVMRTLQLVELIER
jgi:methylmalonyl-CoA/ethylmalonyl-CoA epimerase